MDESRYSMLRIRPDPAPGRRLHLHLGTKDLECILDPDLSDPVGGEPPVPVRTVDRWIAELQEFGEGGEPLMLPFNFSDQCTAWMRVTTAGSGLVRLQAGWSLVGQYDRDFSDFIAVGRSLPDFRIVPGAVTVAPRAAIIAAMTAARAVVADHYRSDRAEDQAQVLALIREGRFLDAAAQVGLPMSGTGGPDHA